MEINKEVQEKAININNKEAELARYRNQCMLAKLCPICGGKIVESEEKLEHTFMSDYKYQTLRVCSQCGCHFNLRYEKV